MLDIPPTPILTPARRPFPASALIDGHCGRSAIGRALHRWFDRGVLGRGLRGSCRDGVGPAGLAEVDDSVLDVAVMDHRDVKQAGIKIQISRLGLADSGENRSEEHPAEFQLLMRNTNAVL